MKRIILLTAIAAALSLLAADRARETKLQQAIDLMGTKGDLPGAIKLLEDVSKSPDRNLAARSLLYLGDCRQKLGQQESRKPYERIISEFADQKEVATEARARLAALGGSAQPGLQATRAVWTGMKFDAYTTSLSPDGRYLSFADWDTGNLTLHDLVTGADRLLTNTGNWKRGESEFTEVSAISRDGKQVAYAWYTDKLGRYELRIVNIAGDSKPRRLYVASAGFEYLEPQDWSPDGKWIVVSTRTNNNDGSRTWRIGLISVQDGSLRVLKSGTGGLEASGFSPDGNYLVYSRLERGAGFRGYILSVDGKSEVPLVSGPSSVQGPVWTPDGSRIVFMSERSGSYGLWSVGIAKGKPVGEPEQLKAGFAGNNYPIGFARDGSLYYVVALRQSDIYLAGLDPITGLPTSEPKRVNQRSIGNSWGRIGWLPDGKSLSFFSIRTGTAAFVVHTLATGEERDVPGVTQYPGWFSDGSLMSRQNSGQMVTFRRVDASTGGVQATWTVSALPSGASAVGFSPDLMTWYFRRRDDAVPCEATKCTYVVLARDLQTGRDREMFRTISNLPPTASISHDGRDIAFISADGLARKIMIAPTAGGAPREAHRVPDDAWIRDITWTQNGDRILAFCDEAGRAVVWSLPAKGGSPEKTPLPQRFRFNNTPPSPVVSPDGTQIAFVGVDFKAELWVLTGLFPDAKPAAAR